MKPRPTTTRDAKYVEWLKFTSRFGGSGCSTCSGPTGATCARSILASCSTSVVDWEKSAIIWAAVASAVDNNPNLVASACARGFKAFLSDELPGSEYGVPGRFDALLTSHVLEHMPFAAHSR